MCEKKQFHFKFASWFKIKRGPYKNKITIPRLELLGNLILSRLILTVLNSLKGEIDISSLYAWFNSKVSLAWIKSRICDFCSKSSCRNTKNVPSEKWNFCSTKLDQADLVTRLEKNINLTKNSLWWKGPHFLFEENQNYSKTDDCENKEMFLETFIQDFESEIKNVVITSNKTEHLIPSTVDNIIKASNYNDINRLFRVTAFVVRFVKNLFRKIKGENLKLFNYADATEIYEAKIHWIKANQLLLLKCKNYENLSKNLTLKFDEENIISCYSRLENGNKNSHPIMLSGNHELTKLIILRCYKKIYHNGVKQL